MVRTVDCEEQLGKRSHVFVERSCHRVLRFRLYRQSDIIRIRSSCSVRLARVLTEDDGVREDVGGVACAIGSLFNELIELHEEQQKRTYDARTP